MRAHYLQHVPFEGLGSIEFWFDRGGHEVSSTRFFESDGFPEVEDIDFLVVMGGSMSVNDEQAHPWLIKEKAFIRKVADAGKPVLGICLGAQLIADAMGGRVFPGVQKEIGWFPIEAVGTGRDSVFQFPEATDVFHWHGETFRLPEGAMVLARSKAFENQAFQMGRNVLGLQFHLETTPSSMQAIIDHCRDELVEGEYIQSEAEMLSAPRERYAAINALMDGVLESLQENAGLR